MYMCFIKLTIMVCLLSLCGQSSYGQEIEGKWKCSKEMFKAWGLRYASMNGKVKFKDDKTFKMVVKGRSHMGHKFWRKRNITIKVKGTYTMKKDSLVLVTDSDNVKCYVDPGIENPVNSSRYEKFERLGTWNPVERRYEREMTMCKHHAQAVKKQMYGIWNKGYRLEQPDEKHLKLGKDIVLEK